MPITCKRREEDSDEEHTFTSFVYKARWFVLNQTDGQELPSELEVVAGRMPRLDQPIVVLHGLIAATTLVLVLLAALDVGGS